ncbi:hydroxylamine oxidoreductase [candidate division GN15 bacterium]|nr:hydroxylamine oxidoreductase [candidate division GN15 bacterium]
MKLLLIMTSVLVIVLTSGVAAQNNNSEVAGRCITCHKEKSPGLYRQWYESQHAVHKVGCIDCHGARSGEPDAFEHYDGLIATLVTPKDCGACHQKEAEEVSTSYHASAGQILESADAYLAHVAAGDPVAILGCESCHGANVQIDPAQPNRLSKESWPNSGIGRINPDGSLGSCNACHTRHAFSKAQARQPEACSKCHLGPDHPQKEVYEESKHGNTYYTNVDKMNLEADSWVVGDDYYVAPTCATCHMSAAPGLALSHDVGLRIGWTLRPPVSKRKDNWQTKTANMKKVCVSCHGQSFADGHYYQFDATVRLYNEKFAKPATDLMKIVRDKNLLENPASFSNKIEWTYWELWHHEGRRARHGAAMMGPDYTWWHGMYEVAQHFYFKLVPEARKLHDADVDAFLDDLFENDPMHAWVYQKTDKLKKDIQSGAMQQVYERFYEEVK